MYNITINDKKLKPSFDNYSILNVGAGRTFPIDIKEFSPYPFLINLDKSYIDSVDIEELEKIHSCYVGRGDGTTTIIRPSRMYKCKHDIFNFLETYYNKFDLVCVYRFLEHVSFTQVPYFIYLLSQIVKKDGLIDIIVPDYTKLADMILEENVYSEDFEYNNILLTTELLNEPYDPHASIWTVQRLFYYFGLENRFHLSNIFHKFEFENRDIYIRAIFRRV